MLRYGFATHLTEAGAGIADICEFLGHANLSMTTRYTSLPVGASIL